MKTHIDRTKYKNLLESYNCKIQDVLPTRVTMESKTCIDNVITSFPIQTLNIPLTISEHYPVEPIITLQQCLTKNDCSRCLKRKNLNELESNKFLKFRFLLNNYLCVISQFPSIDENTCYILGTINKCAKKVAPEEYTKPSKVKET